MFQNIALVSKIFIFANNKSMKSLRLFFILFLFLGIVCFNSKNYFCYANSELNYEYIINYNNKKYQFNSNEIKLNLTKIQRENYHNLKSLNKLYGINFSKEECLDYVFPEISKIIEKLSKIVNINECSDQVRVKENSCELEYIYGLSGKCINRLKFYEDCFEQIQNKKINISLETIDYKHGEDIKKIFTSKGCFSTNYSTSSLERKNNIKVALKSLDGIVIDEGEIFSFNEITGKRNEENGYMQAKIIKNGTFALGFGGGVCQVSTTLYNACLLSDLEIIEATPHSLPVSYVEPSFDAMVSFGVSDLKVRNNSGGKIIITTCSDNDICKIKIFGLKNKYKITRQSEKIKVISAEPDEIETDYEKYGDFNLEIGEEKRLSYPKDGFISRAYLNYYDEKGELLKRRQIRENRYNSTRGVIIRREK